MTRLHLVRRAVVGLAALSLAALSPTACKDSQKPDLTLRWSDEFDGTAGQLPDAAKWTYDVGTGWGNAQIEYDTDHRAANVSLDGEGHLAITVRRESYAGHDFTSGRITTRGLYEPTHGRIEARIKLPSGAGLWPAFWLLGADFGTAGWPQCGEIDVMEARGQEPSWIFGSLHGPGYSGGSGITRRYGLPNDRFDTGFHTFAVEWDEGRIDWSVDGVAYQRVTPSSVSGPWVFDHAFAIILNVAVGGTVGGVVPGADVVFPQSMLVDWVRVYGDTP